LDPVHFALGGKDELTYEPISFFSEKLYCVPPPFLRRERPRHWRFLPVVLNLRASERVRKRARSLIHTAHQLEGVNLVLHEIKNRQQRVLAIVSQYLLESR